MANEKSAELTKPSVGTFDDPASFVTPEFPAVLVTPELAVVPVRHDEVDTALCEPLAQWIGVVGRRFGSGSRGSINSHCASLNNSNRFLLMQEVNQTTRLMQKSPA